MTDNEIIKALFADGMPLWKVARKMDMTCQEVRSVLNTNNGAYRPYTMPASATNKLLCVMAAVYNPTSNMQEVAIIGEQATGIFYTGECICRWMSVLGFAERLRVRMAVRYQSRIHAMWVLFMAGRLEVA